MNEDKIFVLKSPGTPARSSRATSLRTASLSQVATSINLNNVECVYLNSPAGEYEVRVIASELGGNALTPFTSAGQQDFALVIDNACRVSD